MSGYWPEPDDGGVDHPRDCECDACRHDREQELLDGVPHEGDRAAVAAVLARRRWREAHSAD